MTWVSVGVAGGSALLGGFGANKQKKRQDQLDAQAGVQAQFEREQDARTRLARGQIDAAYDSPRRQAGYDRYANALRGYLGTELGRRKVDTGRNLKFALAKQGLTGGSVDVDTTRRLGDEFAQAALMNERSVQGGLADLRNTDEASRIALHNMAGQGMNATTAGRRAVEGFQQNAALAANDARVKGIGDVFSDTAATYKAINERAALRRGYGYNASRSDLYGRQPT
jgi:hypothetical protein